MNKLSIITIILVMLLIHYTSQASFLKPLNKQCLCDVTDQCDSECCCDTACDSTLVTQWQSYNMCLDDSFGIPFCSKIDQTDTNILDLHSGLRTIYSVIKRLVCISSVNFVKPEDWFRKTVRDEDLKTEMQAMTSVQAQSVLNNDISGETQFAISGLPLRDSNGLCRSSSQITKNHEKSSSCRVYVKDKTTLLSNSLLSLTPFLTAFPTIQVFTTKQPSTGSPTSQSLLTVCSTSTNLCQNVIRQIKIFINLSNGTIDSRSYVVVGPITIDQVGYVNVDYEYQFVSVDAGSGVVTFPAATKVGYQVGSRLNLVYKDASGQYFKVFTPLNLAFRKVGGSCRTSSSDDSSNSFVDLRFGQNQAITCLGTTNLISQHLLTSFNYIGKHGTSSTKLSEFIPLTHPSTTISGSQSVQLIFYYINIGVPQNPQYEISKVEVKPVTIKDGSSGLFMEFVGVGNSVGLYVPPAPVVDAYLPNDFLYPFFVA